MLARARSRSELLVRHVDYMAKARGLDDYKWFEKTPQHVYGIPLIRSEFPKAQFLHIVRNPMNVVASLLVGKVVKVDDLIGATNYWIEAVKLVDQARPLMDGQLLEIRYEDLVADVPATMGEILTHSKLGDQTELYRVSDAHPERNQFRKVLSKRQKQIVASHCGRLAERYGYDLDKFL